MNRPRLVLIASVILALVDILFLLAGSLPAAIGTSNISCTALTTCTKTAVLYAKNDTGGFHDAHAENVSVAGYPWTVCCNADQISETVTTSCGTNAAIWIRLYNTTDSHVQVPALSSYLVTPCLGVTNRNVTCSNYTGSCPATMSCIASMASSEDATNSTNAHIDANCSTSYSTKLCCGFSDRLPTQPTLLTPTNSNNTIHPRFTTFTWSNTTDPDLDTIWFDLNITTNSANPACGPWNYTNIPQNFALNSNNFTSPAALCVRTDGAGNVYYNWTVRVCTTGGCGPWASWFNFTIEPYVDINLTVRTIDFGNLALSETRDTSGGSPAPFTIQNDGNVVADLVNISANQSLWQSVALSTIYFRAKANLTSEGAASFNTSGSQMAYTNIGIGNMTMVRQLNWTDAADSAAIDIQVQVPVAEPAGAKKSYLIFNWVQTP